MDFYNLETVLICIFTIIIYGNLIYKYINFNNKIYNIFFHSGIISYILGYLYLTLLSRVPTGIRINLNPFYFFCTLFFDRQFLLGWLLNILLYIPFGMFLPTLKKYYFSYKSIAVKGAFVSFFTELIQLITHLGWFDTEDILMNTIGAAIGFGIFRKFIIRRD